METLCKKCNLISEHSIDPRYNKPRIWCKKCQREYSKNHYYANKEKHLTRRKVNKQRERKIKLDAIRTLKNQPCQDCNKTYPYYVMQFDHRDPLTKSFTISDSIDAQSLSRLKEEIQKCDVVCANCHAERTWGS